MSTTGKEKILSSKQIYKGHIVELRVDIIELPDGAQVSREIVEHRDCVAIVAIDNNNCVLMVRQYRRAVDEILFEIPAGMIEPDENPDEAAKRELQEETGYLPLKLQKLGGFYASPGFCTEYMHLYLATELVPSKLKADSDEFIEVEHVPLDQIQMILDTGQIHDAKSIAGLLTVLVKRRT
ncbi:MAG: NUDIX hydrolase [Chloroflexi bacterium]|nr:NUDIX hydrolase [Chloroflexota bacterium]